MHIGNISLLSHLVVEIPACLSFLLQPNVQLRDPNPSPEAVLVCQSYAGLLLATNALCLLFLKSRGLSQFDETGVMLASSLAIYHAFPIRRAWVRIWHGQRRESGTVGGQGERPPNEAVALGGPVLHIIVHLLLLGMLTWAALNGGPFSGKA